jgi:hypothetical protein
MTRFTRGKLSARELQAAASDTRAAARRAVSMSRMTEFRTIERESFIVV